MSKDEIKSVVEIAGWFDEADVKNIKIDEYMLACAMRKDAYDSREDVELDHGKPVRLVLRAVVTLREDGE